MASTAAALRGFQFGPHLLPLSQVFFVSQLCFASVNLKPVVPGHVLVCPKRCAARYEELTADELADLAISVQKVAKVIEKHYSGTSLTMAIQDGPEAGQTVPHVHYHILPRKADDFLDNDQVYHELAQHDRPGVREPRTKEEMAAEAAVLRKYFPHNTPPAAE